MMPEAISLPALAADFCDDKSIDWAGLAKSAQTPEQKAIVSNFRVIAQVFAFGTDSTADIAAWGPFRIDEKLGEGTFGVVFKAWEPILERYVAVKIYRPSLQQSDADRETLLREGRLLARVEHTNVVSIFGAAVTDERAGIWMQFVAGRTLEQLLFKRAGPLSDRETAEIGMSVCRALRAVHRQGMVHRDVKAQNVMQANDGRILLMDMGLGVEAERTRIEPVGGTPLYMAPELLDGTPATAASDVYALGVLLYHLVSEDFPLSAASLSELKRMHREGRAVPLQSRKLNVDKSLCKTVERALNPAPLRRPSLSSIEAQLAQIASVGFLTPRVRRAAKALLAVICFALVSLALGIALKTYQAWKHAEDLFLEGQSAYRDEQPEEAIRLLLLALEAWPEWPKALATAALYEQAVGRFEGAMDHSERAFRLQGGLSNADKHWVRAVYFNLRLNYEQARDEYIKLSRLDPDNAEVLRQISHIEGRLGDWSSATQFAQAALDIAPEDPHNLGRLWECQVRENPSAALEMMRRDRRRLGEKATPYLSWPMGVALLIQPDPESARTEFNALERARPAYASDARIKISQTYLLEGKLEEARLWLQESASQDHRKEFQRGSASKTYLLSQIDMIEGNSAEAARRLEGFDVESILPTWQSLNIARNIAVLAADLGRRELAQGVLKRLSSFQQTDIVRGFADQIRAHIALEDGDLPSANQQIEKAWRSWEDAGILRSRAQIAMAEKNYPRAVRLLEDLTERAGETFEDDSAALWLRDQIDLATCYLKLQRTAEAQRLADRLASLWRETDPQFEFAQQMRSLRQALR